MFVTGSYDGGVNVWTPSDSKQPQSGSAGTPDLDAISDAEFEASGSKHSK